MKNYVVGYLSFFDNNLVLEKVQALNEYEAVKKAMLQICSEQYKQDELDYQNSENYPQNLSDLKEHYFNADAILEVIEI